MSYKTTTKGGKEYVLVPKADFERMAQASELVPLPPVRANGTSEAVPFARATIANSIIRDRKALGWSQAELARQAKMNVETLNRIEKGKVTPDTASIIRIDAAISKGNRQSTARKAIGEAKAIIQSANTQSGAWMVKRNAGGSFQRGGEKSRRKTAKRGG